MFIVALFISGEFLSSPASSGGEICVMLDSGSSLHLLGCCIWKKMESYEVTFSAHLHCPVLVKFIHQVSVLVFVPFVFIYIYIDR
jgi:hypothetical protein